MVSTKKKDLAALAIAIGCLTGLHLLAATWFTRFDFTAEKRFTLSPVSRSLVSGLTDKLDVVVYLDGDFPAGFKHLRNSTKDLFNDLKAYSKGNLSFAFVDPSAGSAAQRENLDNELAQQGMQPMQVGVPKEGGFSQLLVYPAAMISYRGRQMAVSLLPSKSGAINQDDLNNASENLEYALVSGMKKLITPGRPLIGITEGHGELNDLQLIDAMNSLSNGYEVRRVNLQEATFEGLRKMKLLIIPKPATAFSEAEKYKIDYFVMHGGRILWSIDNVNAEIDSLRKRGSELTFPKKLNLDDLLFNYGARINYELIADMHCGSIPIQMATAAGPGQMQLFPWLYYPVFVPVSKHPVVKGLDGILSEFANTVDTIAVKGIRKQVLLASSPYSRVAPSPAMVSLKMVEQEADPKAFRSVELPAAVLLEGLFPSAFSGRPVPEGMTAPEPLPVKSTFTKMIVIGDGDIFANQVNGADGSPYPLGYDRYSQQQYANKTLLLNAVDYLTDDSGLISLRSREIRVRLLDRSRIRESKLFWQVLNILLPVLLVLLAAIFHYGYRYRKYGKVRIR